MEPFKVITETDTIAAVATPPGTGGIAVIRVSGPAAIEIVSEAWKGADLLKASSHTAHLGNYLSVEGNILDEALATVFRAPKSFTGENVVELSIHGSSWLQKEVLDDLVKRGVRIANPGEFTQRAFINGKLDLAQAEGVADLIAASSKAAHDMAITQTKGKFSAEFNRLRDKLIEFASLLELELDFSEEDVEFADRDKLISLCREILDKVENLAASYANGAVLKNGVPTVIAGIPNAGKSSLLNLLVDEDKAIVTDIPGTTRDIIEATARFNGVCYRFIDTAGLRETSDKVEEIGVGKAMEAMKKAFIIIWILDRTQELAPQLVQLENFKKDNPDKHVIILLNKADIREEVSGNLTGNPGLNDVISFSTATNEGHKELQERMHKLSTAGRDTEKDIIVTNARHFEALTKAAQALTSSLYNLQQGFSADLIAPEIRQAISHLSIITGSITTDTLLHSIFSRFCIGK